MKLLKLSIFVICLLFIAKPSVYAQTSPSIVLKDSTKSENMYPYALPIMGEKVSKLGFTLPYPHGVMLNYFQGVQHIKLSGLEVGFNDSEYYNLDEIVEFDNVYANTKTFNCRLDSWLLPFFDAYVMFGTTKGSSTNIEMVTPVKFQTSTDVSGQYYGVGGMLAGAIGPFFISGDVNNVWSTTDKLNKPASMLNISVRSGPVFRFKKVKNRNITVWTGFFNSHLSSGTDGHMSSSELFPNAPYKVDEISNQWDAWYNGLGPISQNKLEDVYNGVSNGLDKMSSAFETTDVKYRMKKEIEEPWTMVLGAQYQHNLRWQFRTEVQFLGDRTAGLISLNYRFGIKGKNWLSGEIR